MRKTLAIAAATGALLFGGAGAANAEPAHGAVPSTTTLAADDYGNDNDNAGLWGLTGLLGLLGLLGLRRHRDDHDTRAVGAGHRTADTSLGATGRSGSAPTVPHTNPANPGRCEAGGATAITASMAG